MEIGAFFIIVLFVIVVGAIGGGIYLIAAKRRRAELSATATEETGERRPTHRRVENEQQSDFVGTH